MNYFGVKFKDYRTMIHTHFTNRWAVTLLFLISIPILSVAQKTITGTVTDGGTNEPLAGVNVILQGSGTGTVTDIDGTYSLEVQTAAILSFSYIGYLSTEISIGEDNVYNVALDVDAIGLNKVVVVGYGTQEKEDITGAISSVDGEAIQNLPVSSASQAIQGRAAGVQVVRNGGAPGDPGSIRIRGTGTVNNAEPLVVVDGIPLAFGTLADLNPNDIESIEVLKDASASAIYGQRAANGVVLVTTKKGRAGEQIQIEFNAYVGNSSPVRTIDVLDASTLATIKREAYTNDGIDVPEIWNESAFQVQRTNWQEEVLQNGQTQNYDFSIRGGGERSNFAFSGGYFAEDGMINSSFFERTYLRINSDHKLNNWLTIGENIQFTRQTGNFVNTNSAQTGILWSAIRFHPGLPVIATESLPGHEVGDYGSSQISGEFGDINNPIFTTDIEDDQTTNHRILGNVFAEIKILDGLRLKGNIALDGTVTDRDFFEPIIDQQIRARSRNRLGRDYAERYSILTEATLSYSKLIAEKHDLNAVVGFSGQQFNEETFFAERSDFPNEDEDQRFLDAGNTITNASGGKVEDALLSGFARVNYGLNDKYFATATFRADGSSNFAEGNKWGYFPAFSVGWRISREPFFSDISGISYLKLNAGWGQLGNQNVDRLQYLALVASGRRYSFGGEQVVGSSLSRIPNTDISWETAEMTNIGIDLGLMENRLQASFNYFIKDTKDMLLAPPTVGSIGLAAVPDQNVGEVRNQGLEIELGYRNTAGKKLSFSIDANASFIQNEVLSLFDGNFLASRTYGRPNEEISRTFEGEPIGTFYGWQTDGIYQSDAEVSSDPGLANDPRLENGQIQAGDVKFVDVNGDGLIDDEDRIILGDAFPDMTYGLNGSFGYGNFDLNVFFLGVAGVDIYNADRMQGLDASYPFNLYAEAENRWTPSNGSNTIPRASVNRDNRNFRTSDLFVENGSFIRLKNISLGYSLPQSLIQSWGMSKLRFYITGQNVFTITDYSGLDPELGYVDGNLQQNVDYAQFPQARSFIFGLTAGF